MWVHTWFLSFPSPIGGFKPGKKMYNLWENFFFPWIITIHMKTLKRGYQIGNMKIDKRGDSSVFDFFSFGPPYEMKKIKVV